MIKSVPSLLLLFTACAQLGYVKVELMGEKTSPQACQFNSDFSSAKCVEIEAFLREFDDQMKKSLESPETSELMKFNFSWMNTLETCESIRSGYMCVND